MVGVENRERDSFSETFDAHMFALFEVRKDHLPLFKFINLFIQGATSAGLLVGHV